LGHHHPGIFLNIDPESFVQPVLAMFAVRRKHSQESLQSQARWRVVAFSSSSPCWLRAMRTIGRSIVDVGATARTRAGENASPTLWRCRVRSLVEERKQEDQHENNKDNFHG
jgi:hypothetical protein